MWLAPLSDNMAHMTTAASESTKQPPTHPRFRSMESWRARLGVLASRGETDGPRVAEAKAALSYWRRRTFLIREMDISPEQADELLDLIEDHADTDTAETAVAQ